MKILIAILCLAVLAGCAGEYHKDYDNYISAATSINEKHRLEREQATVQTTSQVAAIATSSSHCNTDSCIEHNGMAAMFLGIVDKITRGQQQQAINLQAPIPQKGFFEHAKDVILGVAPYVAPVVGQFISRDIAISNNERQLGTAEVFGGIASDLAASNTAQGRNYVELVTGLPPSTQIGGDYVEVGGNFGDTAGNDMAGGNIGDTAGNDMAGGNIGDTAGNDMAGGNIGSTASDGGINNSGDFRGNSPGPIEDSNNDNSNNPPEDSGLDG